MFQVFKAVVAVFVWLTILVAPCIAAGAVVQSFTPGEKLTFELTWGGIGAGTAVLKVLPLTTVSGAAAYGFEMTARSTKTIDRIFKIRDRLESYADREMTHSLLYKQKISEGGYRKNRLITFDWEKNELTYISNNSKPRQVSIMPGTFDLLAAFYFLRLQPLNKVASVECPITDGKRNVIGRVLVVGRETIQVGGRTYATIVLAPILHDVELFNPGDSSGIRIWVTADAKKMPVLIESRVALGFFRAELRRVEHVSPSEKQ